MKSASGALNRRTALATAAIAVLLGFFAMNDVPIGIFQDDGHYVILARAIANGDGYRYTNLPGAPAATHFPPGYPLLLAAFWRLAPQFPANVAFLKLINVALLPLAALAVRELARRVGGLSVTVSSMVAVVSVATVPVLFLNGLLFSETTFIIALCGVLIMADRFVVISAVPTDALTDAPTASPTAAPTPALTPAPTWRAAALLGLAIGALTLLRTVGVTLLPAAMAILVWRRRWRDAAIVLAGALVFLLPWQLWTSAHARDVPAAVVGAYGAYGPWIADAWRAGGLDFALAVAAENLRGMRLLLMLFGLYEAPVVVQGAAFVALTVLAGAGAVRCWRRAGVSVLVFVPYGLLLLLWPYPPDRFLWPLWPSVLVLLVVGVTHLGAPAARPAARLAVRVVAVLLAAGFSTWHVRNWRDRSWESIERSNARIGIAAAGIALALPRDGLVASDRDAMVHLYAGRPAVPLLALTAEQHVRRRSDAEVAAQLAGVLDAYHPRWLVVGESESLRAAVQLARSGRLKLKGADPSNVLVYDVVR
ncbi:MAG: PT domain-containing protein [Gemmatimonadaceae bacterium]